MCLHIQCTHGSFFSRDPLFTGSGVPEGSLDHLSAHSFFLTRVPDVLPRKIVFLPIWYLKKKIFQLFQNIFGLSKRKQKRELVFFSLIDNLSSNVQYLRRMGDYSRVKKN